MLLPLIFLFLENVKTYNLKILKTKIKKFVKKNKLLCFKLVKFGLGFFLYSSSSSLVRYNNTELKILNEMLCLLRIV